MGTTTVTVLRASSDCRDERIPASLDGLIAMLVKARDAIPAEYRDSAYVSLDPGYDYDDAYPRIWVTYERPETPAEAFAILTERKAQIEEISGGYLRWIADRKDELDDINSRLEAAGVPAVA